MLNNIETKEIRSLVAVKHWREYQASRVLECWEQSGLSLKQFCREFGIGYKRLQYWKKRVTVSTDSLEFIEVIPMQSDPTNSNDSMEINFSNHRSIRITPGFDDSALKRLIRIIED